MKRLSGNPIIRPGDVTPSREDFEVVGAFNAGVTRLRDEVILLLRVAERPAGSSPAFVVAPIHNAEKGKIEILRVPVDDPDLRVEDERAFRYKGQLYLTSISHLRVARSTDGVNFTIDGTPFLWPDDRHEAFGIEDPRITRMGQDCWITYKAVSAHGITTALAHTRDFRGVARKGIVFCPENLDVVIFPEKVDGGYVAWTRPVGRYLGTPSIWVARSPDLVHWGEHEVVLCPRPDRWDASRVGASTVPFRTGKGWLEIYHGADPSNRYCLGVALIDIDDPSKVLARSHDPLMWPETDYELAGFFGGVVFSCGADVRDDGTVTVYYGASDESTCAALTTVDELLAHVKS